MQNHQPYLIGLTGGIGSGKSTVCDMFARLGVEIIDADVVSRELVCAGSPLLAAIARHFGDKVILADGNLDRAALRRIVFEDLKQKDWLEDLLHPAIRADMATRIRLSKGDYTILCVPLLLESRSYDFVDRILVVDVPLEVQVARVCARDGSDEKLVRRIIQSQMPRQQRLQAADDIIDNSVAPEAVAKRVSQLHKQYLELAATKTG